MDDFDVGRVLEAKGFALLADTGRIKSLDCGFSPVTLCFFFGAELCFGLEFAGGMAEGLALDKNDSTRSFNSGFNLRFLVDGLAVSDGALMSVATPGLEARRRVFASVVDMAIRNTDLNQQRLWQNQHVSPKIFEYVV